MIPIRTAALCILLSAGRASAAVSNWPAATQRAKSLLIDLIRVDTVNPPGNETAACRVLGKALDREGIPYEVFESTPGRGSLVARLKGTGAKRPLILMAHLDVVGVERDRWTVDPFAAVEKDGAVYGRGAVDDKGWAAAAFVAMAELKKLKAPLSRDVILVAEADEESGGTQGLRWLLERYPGKLDAEFALNEGGSTRLEDGRVKLLAVQTAEKSYVDLKLTARGPSGHSGAPPPGQAIFALARALARLESNRPAPKLSPATGPYLRALADSGSPEMRAAVDDLFAAEPGRREKGARYFDTTPRLAALIRDTAAPTILGGGLRANVIPSEAWANINVRLLPDTTLDEMLRRLRAAIDDPAIELSVTRAPDARSPIMPDSGALYDALAAAVKDLSPGATVTPYMSAGATDSLFLRSRGVLVYGLKFPLTEQDEARMHGHDERLPVESLSYGVRLLYETVLRVAR